jgi:hypothetical protein
MASDSLTTRRYSASLSGDLNLPESYVFPLRVTRACSEAACSRYFGTRTPGKKRWERGLSGSLCGAFLGDRLGRCPKADAFQPRSPGGEVFRNACFQPSFRSGADVSRTRDLIIANDALYQLSYRPEYVAEPAGKLGRGQV